jgi:hypothetical protein
MKKKILIATLALGMILSLCACNFGNQFAKGTITPTPTQYVPACVQGPYPTIAASIGKTWEWNQKECKYEEIPVFVPTLIPVSPTQNAPQSTQMAAPTQATADFPLKGLRFPAYAAGKLDPAYDYYVEANGRYWQKWLPIGPQRIANSDSLELPAGRYVFNGVICRLYVDADRNGKGSKNPMTAGLGNDQKFSVKLPVGATYKTAFALVECDGGDPSGSDILYLGPLQ